VNVVSVVDVVNVVKNTAHLVEKKIKNLKSIHFEKSIPGTGENNYIEVMNESIESNRLRTARENRPV